METAILVSRGNRVSGDTILETKLKELFVKVSVMLLNMVAIYDL